MYKYGWIKKLLNNTIKKGFFIIYQRTKVQKLDTPINEKAEKPN
jgi:hypothetical protein